MVGKRFQERVKGAAPAADKRDWEELLAVQKDTLGDLNRFFDLLKQYNAKRCVLGAGTKGKDNTLSDGRGEGGGIVPGHAYAILDVREIRGHKLVQLRNPWGSFEWKGAWRWIATAAPRT